jgi:hypothetical protein
VEKSAAWLRDTAFPRIVAWLSASGPVRLSCALPKSYVSISLHIHLFISLSVYLYLCLAQQHNLTNTNTHTHTHTHHRKECEGRR